MNRRELCIAAALATFSPSIGSRALQAKDADPPIPSDPADLSLADASRAIHGRSLSSRELTLACLDRTAALNPRLNAFITVMREQALAQADGLDAEAASGRLRSALHGIPIALKDAIDTAGTRTTAGSAIFGQRVPADDAEVVRRLREAGAIILAKANLSEFSLTATGVSSHFGPVRNPWMPERVSGGSSSGSAAAVAAQMCSGALGTDSGGSVRLPAAWCGIVGLKPTDGLVSNRGIVPSVMILDSCGPMARRVEDVAILLGTMAGFDPLDVRSVDRPAEDYAVALRQPVSSLRVGIPRRPYYEGLDPHTARCVEDALGVLAGLVRGVEDVGFPVVLPGNDPLIEAAEVYSYHEKLWAEQRDRYATGTRNAIAWCADYVEKAARGVAGAPLARYIESRGALERRRRTIDESFGGFDLVAMPTMKGMPPTIEDAVRAESDPAGELPFSIDNTMTFNILGLPALTVPCGFSAEGLPVGLMLAGPRFSEGRLLALAAAYEQATAWHRRRPGLLTAF